MIVLPIGERTIQLCREILQGKGGFPDSIDRHASEGWHLPRLDVTCRMAKGGWTYILTNKPGGVLYIGVTADLPARITQHRSGKGSAFCRRYGLKRLVLVEPHPSIEEAIAREKALKAWQRAWKIRLIEAVNPGWDDLFEVIV